MILAKKDSLAYNVVTTVLRVICKWLLHKTQLLLRLDLTAEVLIRASLLEMRHFFLFENFQKYSPGFDAIFKNCYSWGLW